MNHHVSRLPFDSLTMMIMMKMVVMTMMIMDDDDDDDNDNDNDDDDDDERDRQRLIGWWERQTDRQTLTDVQTGRHIYKMMKLIGVSSDFGKVSGRSV